MEISKDFFVGGGWHPSNDLLDSDFPEWFYKETVFQTEKKKQVYLDGHTFNLPLESHSYVFRWIMPQKPNIYKPDWEIPNDYRMASVLRFTVGEWFGLTEQDLNEVREGRANLSRDKLAHISKVLENSFLFNGLKIPYIEVRCDWVSDKELQNFIDFHQGKTAEQAFLITKNVKESQIKQKRELLRSVTDTLRSKPNFLSILRDVVGEKISVEDAVEMTGNSGIFQKGV